MMIHMIKDLNASLVDRKLRVPALSGAEDAAIDEFTKWRLKPKIVPPARVRS